tara:strand:+ start:15668 stop:16489 length:822 start_codon:yes stop_codon:yes gene_type:complete
MVKLVILGSTGMLGNAVSDYFTDKTGYATDTSYRKEELKRNKNSFYFDATKTPLSAIPECDYIINCIGVIKPFMANSLVNAITINSMFPHKLSKWCKETNKKLIHITTDCVFSGGTGKYSELDDHDCLDSYGKSKSLGEPNDCMVIRTSIIGEEIHQNASLIEWVKKNKGKTIRGYTDHYWNGITTTQFADICHQVIQKNLFSIGKSHVYSNDVSKYELVSQINKSFNLDINIEAYETSTVCDRTLRTVEALIKNLEIPSIKEQLETISGRYK